MRHSTLTTKHSEDTALDLDKLVREEIHVLDDALRI